MLQKQTGDKTSTISTLQFKPCKNFRGNLILAAQHWNRNRSDYFVTVDGDQLLNTAQQCLEVLGRSAGVKYKIVVEVNGQAFYL